MKPTAMNWVMPCLLVGWACAPAVRPTRAGEWPPAPSVSLARVHDALALEEPVEAGRRGLDHRWRYPWYDRQTDELRWIKTRRPFEPPDLFNTGALSMLNWLAWAMIAVIFAALAAVFAWAFFNRDVSRARGARDVSVAAGDVLGLVEALPPGVAGVTDLLGEARRHYRDGRLEEATVYLFGHVLVELDRAHVIRLAKGKTNRQFLREVGQRRPLYDIVSRVMHAFEDVFFGHHRIAPARFDAYWSQLGEFETLVGEGRP